jgi:hypothetical protein
MYKPFYIYKFDDETYSDNIDKNKYNLDLNSFYSKNVSYQNFFVHTNIIDVTENYDNIDKMIESFNFYFSEDNFKPIVIYPENIYTLLYNSRTFNKHHKINILSNIIKDQQSIKFYEILKDTKFQQLIPNKP